MHVYILHVTTINSGLCDCRPDLEKKLEVYNTYHRGQPQELKIREVMHTVRL